ncbi:hypothetical protein Hanom_Chr08g00682351 [Helianthus anomalus]
MTQNGGVYIQWRSLKIFTGGSEVTEPKNSIQVKRKIYKTGGSKTYIPKKFYTKRTYITLLSEKFGGSGAPPGPLKATPLFTSSLVRVSVGMNLNGLGEDITTTSHN